MHNTCVLQKWHTLLSNLQLQNLKNCQLQRNHQKGKFLPKIFKKHYQNPYFSWILACSCNTSYIFCRRRKHQILNFSRVGRLGLKKSVCVCFRFSSSCMITLSHCTVGSVRLQVERTQSSTANHKFRW